MKPCWRLTLALLAACASIPVLAQDAREEANVVLHSTITGNQEQPKVVYIVPWQGPGDADKLNQPMQPVLSDVFAPIDRAEFQRELKYRAESAADNAAKSAAPASQP